MKKYYLPIPFVWYEMKGNQIKVLLALIHASNVYGDEEGWFYRSIDDLMRDSGVTNRNTVVSCLKKIKNRDIIEDRKSNYKNSTLYRLNSEVWLNKPYQVSNSNSIKTDTTETNSNSIKTDTTETNSNSIKTDTFNSIKTDTFNSIKTDTIHTVNKDIENKDKKKTNKVNNDTLGTGVEKMKTESNEGVSNLDSLHKPFFKSSSESLSANEKVTSNEGGGNLDSLNEPFFSLSQDSLPATEITPSTGGEEKKSSNMEVRNASGGAGEALDSSVDTRTTSTPIVQPDTPETPNQTCLDKTTTEEIRKILKGRTFQQFFNDFITWAEGNEGKNATSEVINKVEKKMNTLKESGYGTEKQWKKSAVLISILKGEKCGSIKPLLNRLKELKRHIKACPSHDMIDGYIGQLNQIIMDAKRQPMSPTQHDVMANAISEVSQVLVSKDEELSKYAPKKSQPSRKVFVTGEKSHDKLYQLMDEMDRGGLYKQKDKLEVVRNLINSYAEIYKGEHDSMSGFSRSFSQTAKEWWGVLDPFRSYPLICDVMGEMALHESFN